MSIDSKATQLIQRLTRATVNDEMKWVRNQAPAYLTSGTDDLVPLYLEGVYKGKKIGLFEKRSKYFHDEFDYSWSVSVGICIVDLFGHLIWDYYDTTTALANLFDRAKEQSSGIDDVLNELLDDET
ncbi:hypothetical protein SAMN04487868_112104 [Marinobacter salarius]|jgi:hypothetical protein|uniref:Uncharacterized protein n=1 Tax=Marinobacter salarius TaxID=1420917 RepID=A0ABY1FQI6_9GAMM|nr:MULTISPECIES: hypothetical protein [Marinobacter]KXJ46255.1 MAG: hypothetical protein AXW11_10885 [Marinobacter sp. Hex_13]MDC8453859.1 hypothetical protein [Marinobacter sp. DS40M6]SFL85598.1 hypothetical protein SAMN04487868_112104 [Marinobacter salarius]